MKYVPYNQEPEFKIINVYNSKKYESKINNYYSSAEDYSYLFDEVQKNKSSFTNKQEICINDITSILILMCVNNEISIPLPKLSCTKVDDSVMLEWLLGELRIGFSIDENDDNHTWFLVKRDNRSIRSSSGYLNDSFKECLNSLENGLREYASR